MITRTEVQKLSQALDDVTNIPNLLSVLAHSINETLKLQSSRVFLPDANGNFSTRGIGSVCTLPKTETNFASAGRQTDEWYLEAKGALCRLLRQRRHPIASNMLRKKLARVSLTPNERQVLACVQSRLWVPLTRSRELLGVLDLGPKQCGERFNRDDLQFLDLMVRQICVTIQYISLLSQLRRQAEDMKRLHAQLAQAREQERKRLARDLHDGIIQELVSLNHDLACPEREDVLLRAIVFEKLQQRVRELIVHLRRICLELRPPALDNLGLVAAIRSTLREWATEEGVQVTLLVDGGESVSAPEEVEISFFRVLQESLANIRKHARASNVIVNLVIRPTEFLMSIQDDGRGFTVPARFEQLIDQGHFGLVGACERIEQIGGSLILRSAPGQGTYVETHLLFRNSRESGRRKNDERSIESN